MVGINWLKYKKQKYVAAHKVDKHKRYEIHKIHDIIIGPNQFTCNKCNEKDVSELKLVSIVKPVHVPKFLSNIVVKERKQRKQAEYSKTAADNKRKYRKRANAPLDFNNLTQEEIQQSCGVSKTNLVAVQQHVNKSVEESQETKKLQIDDLFVACCIWRQHMSYDFAASVFGFADAGGIKLLFLTPTVGIKFSLSDWGS